MLKLINPKNKNHKLFPHIFISLEGWGYKLRKYPQLKENMPSLKTWQIIELINCLTEDAKKLNMLLRH